MNLWSWNLAVHAAVGVTLGFLVDKRLDVVANSVFLPLASILVGLTFAWGGNAQGLLQTPEIQRLARKPAGGLAEYGGYYQLAILLILAALGAWGAGGIGLFEWLAPKHALTTPYRCAACALYALTSLTVNECWHVVDSARLLLLARSQITDAEQDQALDAGSTPALPSGDQPSNPTSARTGGALPRAGKRRK